LAKRDFLENVAGNVGIDFMKKLKLSLDENNILNPGKIITSKPKCEGPLPGRREDIPEKPHGHTH